MFFLIGISEVSTNIFTEHRKISAGRCPCTYHIQKIEDDNFVTPIRVT